ncbi:MAG: hypothetical protein U0984_05615 [Prosthecobacter sp.]|nr:hypothetical protein [Prosthecobacter sp.]
MRAIAYFCPFVAAMMLVAASGGAEVAPVQETNYYDETGMRHLRLKQAGFGSTEVEVRFAADPGGAGRWLGIGQRKDKDLIFARVAGEGEDRGTYFIASVSESKVEIRYKPDQKEPQDPGILGTYRRATEGKRQQLAKKEFQAANDRLVTALKTGAKTRSGKERAAISQWKDQWPMMRQRWMDISYAVTPKPAAKDAKPAPSQPPGTAAAPAEAEKGADYWFKLAEATAKGYYFVETMPDPKTGTDWDGEYDDFSGGHVSLRRTKDGRLRMSLSFSRAEDTQTGALEVTAPAEKLTKSKEGDLMADFTYTGMNEETKGPTAQIHLKKLGRYLEVKTDGAEKYAARGWFDGIYRGGPVPEG